MKALNIQIEDFQHEWIRRQAFERRMSMSDVVREIITKSMKGESSVKKRETIAERIAGLLGDGTCWESKDGRHFDQLCEDAGADVSLDRERELKGYLFPDGSAIVAGVGAWDIEGDEPFSWAGAE